MYEDLFRNEHYIEIEVDKPRILRRVEYFVQKGYIATDSDAWTVRVVDKENTFKLLHFFSNLITPLIDTYLVTLVAIE